METFIQYLKDTRAEMQHVSWPSKQQTLSYTLIVIFLSVGVAVLLGVFDVGFQKALQAIVAR